MENQEGQGLGEAPEQTNFTSSTEQHAPEQSNAFVLDSVDKFTWQGKEWTTKDLQSQVMAHSDYTRKTQAIAEERKRYEESSKYMTALQHDLATLKEEPWLYSEFLQKYPKQYHGYAKFVINSDEAQQAPKANTAQVPAEFRQVADKVSQIEQEIYESKVQRYQSEIDSIITKMSEKYPETKDEDTQELILARAQSLLDRGQKITPDVWEQLFKSANEKVTARFQSKVNQTNTKQLEANARAKDTPNGGAVPGKAPRVFKDMREATQAAVEAAMRSG